MKPLRTRRLPWTAALCLLSGCAGSGERANSTPAAPQPSAQTGEVIELHFAWPVGLTARVEYEENGEEKSPEGAESIVFRSSHRMRVEQVEEGIRVVHDEFSIEPVTSAEGAKSSRSPSSQDTLETESEGEVGDLLPDLIVDHTGKLLRITGTDRLRADALERMSKGTEQTPESRARLERFIEHAVSDAALTERATRDWNALVSLWVGVRLAVGVTPAPLVQGGASDRLSVTARVPCDAKGGDAKCVRIELVSQPTPELRNTILLVTEPDRLVPHEVRVANEVHARMARPDGKSEEVNRTNAWSYRFSYSSGS